MNIHWGMHWDTTCTWLKLGSYYTKVGWKICRPTIRRNCATAMKFGIHQIQPFMIKPQWISYSVLWKVELETFQRQPGKLTKESCFTRTILPHPSLWLQWLLCVTLAFNLLITLHILLIWHHLTTFCSPTWKKKLVAGKQYWTDDEVISAIEYFV